MVTRNVVRSGITRNVTRGVTESFFSGLTPQLHYEFSANKTLAATVGPTLSITRATSATYRDSSGILQTASSGTARFDHDKDGNSLGLSVEGARTNIALHSAALDNAAWTTSGTNVTVTADAATGPDGASTLDKVGDDSSTGTGQVNVLQSVTVATSTAYCVSCFMKADQLTFGRLRINGMAAQTLYADANLTTGAIGTTGADVTDSGIEDWGSGLYRVWFTFTSDGTDTSCGIAIHPITADNNPTVDLDGTSSIFAGFAGLEAGAFPTSYIATTTASVTRNVDDISTTDLSWLNEVEGSVYAKATARNDTTATKYIVSVNDNTPNNQSFYAFANNNTWRSRTAVSASPVASFFAVVTVLNTEHQIAHGYKANDFAGFVDGTQQTGSPDTSGAVPTGMTKFQVGNGDAGTANPWNGHIAEIRYYNTRLTDAQLEDMSNGVFP